MVLAAGIYYSLRMRERSGGGDLIQGGPVGGLVCGSVSVPMYR